MKTICSINIIKNLPLEVMLSTILFGVVEASVNVEEDKDFVV